MELEQSTTNSNHKIKKDGKCGKLLVRKVVRTNTFRACVQNTPANTHKHVCHMEFSPLPLPFASLELQCCSFLALLLVVVCTVFFLCFDRQTSLNKSRWPPKHTNRPMATKRPHSTLPKKESTWKRFFCLSSCRGSVHQLIFPFC